jgi:TonB family protein
MSPLLMFFALLGVVAPAAPAAPAASSGSSRAPVLVAKVEPEYPEAARRAYRTGKVVLSFTVQPSGSVTDIEVVQSAGPELDQSAIAAVSRWRYEPATEGGQPAAAHGTVAIPFSLELEGRVLDAGAEATLVIFDRGTPELALPRHARLLRLRRDHTEGAPESIGALSLERRAQANDRPTYEALLLEGGPPRVGDLVRVTLGPTAVTAPGQAAPTAEPLSSP